MTPDDTIHASLVRVAGGVERAAGGRWSFALRNGTAFAAEARIDDGWLVMEAAAGPPADLAPPDEAMLGWNAMLDGGARFVRSARRPHPHVRAEVPLDGDVDLPQRIAEACAGFATAKVLLHHPKAAALTAVDACTAAEVLAQCRDTGWPVKEREHGRVAVDLEVPGAFRQAVVASRADGRIAASVPILDPTATGDAATAAVCRRALALFLVRTCGVVRVARAALGSDGLSRLEVVYAAPSVGELAHAFAALSIACRLAGDEAAVLRHDETVAAAYLRQWDDAVARRAT